MGFTWPIYVAASFLISLAQFLDQTYGAEGGQRGSAVPKAPGRLKLLTQRLVQRRARPGRDDGGPRPDRPDG
jgi:hypothetical protein